MRAGLVLVGKRSPRVGARAGEVRVPSGGRMRVVLNVHGGQQGLADVIAGLTERNARAIAEGNAEAYTTRPRRLDATATAWRDAPQASRDDYVSGRTAAAWLAGTMLAERRAEAPRGAAVAVPRVGFVDGQPAVFADGQLVEVFGGPALPAELEPTEGRTDERMLVTIDDNEALPVREINQAIARHNARRIELKGLPPLYRSGVVYKTEGSPELWWDAEEILAHGHDDCEGLAAYRAGELLLRGYDARVYTRLVQKPDTGMGGSGKKGGRLFHAVTRIYRGPDGQPITGPDGVPAYDDPSARLGMPKPQWYLDFAKKMRAQGKDI